MAWPQGVTVWRITSGKTAMYTSRFPTEYRCNIVEVFQYGQRVRKLHRGQSPSSAVQLPIMAALHAGLPTLFASIIQQATAKVNTFLLIGR